MYLKQEKERALQLYDKTGSVSEETEYSRQSIYAWRRKYLQKGLLTLVPQKDVSRGKIMANYKTTSQSNENPDVEKLKKQMKDLQLEVDILDDVIVNIGKLYSVQRTVYSEIFCFKDFCFTEPSAVKIA